MDYVIRFLAGGLVVSLRDRGAEHRPLMAVAVALGVGILIGIATRSRV